jgi:hypothetical protein
MRKNALFTLCLIFLLGWVKTANAENNSFMNFFRGITNAFVVTEPNDPNQVVVQIAMLHATPYIAEQQEPVRLALENAVVLSQKEVVQRVEELHASLNDQRVLLFTEGTIPEHMVFIQEVMRFCSGNGSPSSFLTRVGSNSLTNAIVRYRTAVRTNTVTEAVERAILLEAGAEWKLTCDGVAQIMPLETRESISSGSSAFRSMRQLTQVTLEQLRELNQPNWNDFSSRIHTAQNGGDRPSVWFSNLLEQGVNPETENLLRSAIPQFIQLEHRIYDARERVIMETLVRSRGNEVGDYKLSVFTLGSNHDLREVIPSQTAYVRLETDPT